MVMNEKAGDFLRYCAASASTVVYCKQYMLAVLLAVAHKSIWLFVSSFLIVGWARDALLSPFCSLDHMARSDARGQNKGIQRRITRRFSRSVGGKTGAKTGR